MLDYTDLSAWTPPLIAVSIVCVVLLGIYRMARTVQTKMEAIEQKYQEQAAKKGPAAKKPTREQRADHRSRIEEIERYRTVQKMCMRIGIAVVGVPAALAALLIVRPPWGPILALTVVVVAVVLLRGTVTPPTYSRSRNTHSAKGS